MLQTNTGLRLIFFVVLGTRKSPGIVATIVHPLLKALEEWGLTFEVVVVVVVVVVMVMVVVVVMVDLYPHLVR